MTKKLKLWFYLSLSSMLLQSLTLLSVSVFDFSNTGKTVIALLFWLLFIVYGISLFLTSAERRRVEKTKFRIRQVKKNHMGIYKFFIFHESKISDYLFFASTVAIIISLLLRSAYVWLNATSLFLFFISFNMHCLFNGKNYIYIKSYENYKRRMKNVQREKQKN